MYPSCRREQVRISRDMTRRHDGYIVVELSRCDAGSAYWAKYWRAMFGAGRRCPEEQPNAAMLHEHSEPMPSTGPGEYPKRAQSIGLLTRGAKILLTARTLSAKAKLHCLPKVILKKSR
jgi:hypothetical protein